MGRWEETQATTTTQALQQRDNPAARDFDGKTDQDLEKELRELTVSRALSARGSAAYAIAVNRIRAIDAELARRAEAEGYSAP